MKKLLIILISVMVLQSCTKDKDHFNIQPEKINLDKLKIKEIEHTTNDLSIQEINKHF